MIFGVCELGVAIFGLSSLRIFHWAAEYTAGASLGLTILFSFLLLIVPTMLMGATLPLLVEQLVRSSRDVGHSVAILYFANTLGSAFACYLCAEYVMLNFGQSGSVTIAACLNVVVGTVAYLIRSQPAADECGTGHRGQDGANRRPTWVAARSRHVDRGARRIHRPGIRDRVVSRAGSRVGGPGPGVRPPLSTYLCGDCRRELRDLRS